MSLNLLIDLSIIALLCFTIYFAIKLSKQLQVFRDNRENFADMIEGFQSATLRAEKSIHLLHSNAKEAGESLQEHIDKAQGYRDEIMFLLDRGTSLADRLEEDIKNARDTHKASEKKKNKESKQAEAKEEEQKNDDPKIEDLDSEVERQFYEALKNDGIA